VSDAIDRADVVVGYSAYIDLIRDDYPGKPFYQTGMTGEVERCREALRLSREGKRVAVICSGDAAVYGMASLILELAEESDYVEVLPGVTAALAASAILGAPLASDMAIISLSDLLTPWVLIEKRLDAAALGDFCIALYNPSSKKRGDYLSRAVEILLKRQKATTWCGWVRNAGRAGQESRVMTLGELRDETVDMFTTVIVGNSYTICKHGRLVTPRGYRL
jgi:precorrin-3B C17-methyltransferase